MKTAEELLRSGHLGEALAAQTAHVKAHPVDADGRFVLFQLLVFAGELERAEGQLEVVAHRDAKLELGAATYRSLLAAEYERRKVHREGWQPVLSPDPPSSLPLRLQALRALGTGDAGAAREALEAAVARGVELSGKLNGEAFDGLRDYDDVLGQILEVYAGGRCLWLPFERIRRLAIAPPHGLLDLFWVPAELDDADGVHATVHLPALYAGSHEHPEERVRLGRRTEWLDRLDVAFQGAGQKVLLAAGPAGERQVGLLEVRTLEIEAPAAEAG